MEGDIRVPAKGQPSRLQQLPRPPGWRLCVHIPLLSMILAERGRPNYTMLPPSHASMLMIDQLNDLLILLQHSLVWSGSVRSGPALVSQDFVNVPTQGSIPRRHTELRRMGRQAKSN